MASILPFISSSSSLFFPCLYVVFRAHQIQLVSQSRSRSWSFFFKLSSKYLSGKIRWMTFFLLIKSSLIILPIANFFHQFYLLVFHRSLSDNKSTQVSWTLLSILTDLNSAVVCMYSMFPLILPLIFYSSTIYN